MSDETSNLIGSKLTCRKCGREGGRESWPDVKDHGTIAVHDGVLLSGFTYV